MTIAGSPVSTNGVRNNSKKRGAGLRLLICICFLVFLVIILIIWEEELVDLPMGSDLVVSKPGFAWRPLRDDNTKKKKGVAESSSSSSSSYLTDDGGDGIMITTLNRFSSKTASADDDDANLFSSSWGEKLDRNSNNNDNSNWFQYSGSRNKFKIKEHRSPRKKKKKHEHKHAKSSDTTIHNNNNNNNNNNNMDTIPLARLSAGAFLYASDALLCRGSVIDYVINATDLKDECDGLKKAYTENCVAAEDQINQPSSSTATVTDESSSFLSRNRHQRRLPSTKKNPIIYLQSRLKQIWDFSLYNNYNNDDNARVLFNDSDKNLKFSHYSILTWKERLLDYRNHRKILEYSQILETGDNEGEKDTSITTMGKVQPHQNTTQSKSSSKLTTNLALPITSKHVSGKTLTETLMLQQDDKLMKAIQNQTNSTTTEAKTDAAVSSKAVSDAADMVSNVLNDPTSVEARTCCTSILNVFHENCSVNEEEELSDRRLFVGVMVVAFCGLVKSLIRHYKIRWLPEAGGCILVGVSAGYILTFYPHHDISFDGNWFLRIMVPPIVFEAALSIDKRSFNRHIVPILLYAVLGTLIASGITAIVVHEGSKMLKGVCDTIPYPEALAFGSLISSIDPIAVLSVLSSMGMTDQDTIYVIIFGESLLNDGVAIVLFETLVHFLDDNMVVDGHAVAAAAIHFIVVFIGSLLIGIGYGLCCTLYYWIMIGCQTPLVEVLMFCCWALLPYYVCDGIAWSGIVAVVAAGFIMDIYVVGTEVLLETSNDETYLAHSNDFQNSNTSDSNKDSLPSFPDIDSNNSNNHKERKRSRKRRRAIFSKEGLLSRGAKTHVVFVTEVISTMMETAIFAYLGLFLFSSRYHWNFYHVIVGITGCCLSRAIMIPSLSFVANWITRMQQSGSICRFQEHHQSYYPDTHTNRQNIAAGVIVDSKMQLVLWFAGLRGAMSFALVEHILLYDAVSGEGTRLKSELKAMTSACIMFTLFLLGGSTFYMIEALGLSPKSRKESTKSEEEELEMMGLLGSTPASKSIDAEEIGIPEYDTDGAEIYKRCVRKSA